MPPQTCPQTTSQRHFSTAIPLPRWLLLLLCWQRNKSGQRPNICMEAKAFSVPASLKIYLYLWGRCGDKIIYSLNSAKHSIVVCLKFINKRKMFMRPIISSWWWATKISLCGKTFKEGIICKSWLLQTVECLLCSSINTFIKILPIIYRNCSKICFIIPLFEAKHTHVT